VMDLISFLILFYIFCFLFVFLFVLSCQRRIDEDHSEGTEVSVDDRKKDS
jgi:hypothetical protein